ncbi:MAG: hypothetical protein EXQ86_05240 [Rhodospirillales bacterium]|nr:hypothetical protein [Rhodospirillales bacterium]
MPLKDIFLHADSGPEFRGRLGVALNLAAGHEAHLTAIFVPTLPKEKRSRRASRVPMEVMGRRSKVARETSEDRIVSYAWERIRVASEEHERLFGRLADRASVPHRWIYDELPLLELLSLHARFCDVLIISQPATRAAAERLIAGLDLPVLLVPKNYRSQRVGTNVMIAWDRSPAALRAANNALPFLREAIEVKVVSVNLKPIIDHRTSYTSGMIEHLARHNIEAERLLITAKDKRISDAILSAPEKQKSDLIVMGAFGKRRGLRGRLLGGVTSNVIQDTTAPLLLTS